MFLVFPTFAASSHVVSGLLSFGCHGQFEVSNIDLLDLSRVFSRREIRQKQPHQPSNMMYEIPWHVRSS
jgi:hypothetical protein